MPLGKQYEFNLLHPLGLSPLQIEPIWIRLKTHSYKTWDIDHLNNHYLSWEEANEKQFLDGLIITGAPVEHLDFEEVNFLWMEARQCRILWKDYRVLPEERRTRGRAEIVC